MSSTTLLKHNADNNSWPVKGEWRAVRDRFKRKYATFCCPECGTEYSIGLPEHDHQIATTGIVSPAVSCGDGCKFTGVIKLDDWPI